MLSQVNEEAAEDNLADHVDKDLKEQMNQVSDTLAEASIPPI
jgi:hypothetical protein